MPSSAGYVLTSSLLHVSLLLVAPVCANGFPPEELIDAYGGSDNNPRLPALTQNTLYTFPSMSFSCDGTITDIRMRMDFVDGIQPGQRQDISVYFLVFHDGLNSPTRRVTHVHLNQTNTRQELPNEIWTNNDPLSLPVTEGSFIGFAIPGNKSSNTFFKTINLSPTSERVEVHQYKLSASFSEFEGRMLEAARTADSSQFTTQMIALPLIDVSFSK